MRIAGILQPGTTLNYVTESRYIKGGLVVVQTLEERDQLANENNAALVNGSPVYVAGLKKTYRYNADTNLFSVEPVIVEDGNGVLCTLDEEGNPKKIKVEVNFEDLAPELKEEIAALPSVDEVEKLISDKLGDYITLSSFTKTIRDIEVKLNKKQDQLTAGKGIRIENNVISAVYENVDQVIFATKNQFPYIGEEDRLYVAKNEKNIYI